MLTGRRIWWVASRGVFVLAATLIGGAWTTAEPLKVSICTLDSDKSVLSRRYEGVRVQTEGFLVYTMHGAYLSSNKCKHSVVVVIDISEDSRAPDSRIGDLLGYFGGQKLKELPEGKGVNFVLDGKMHYPRGNPIISVDRVESSSIFD